MEAARGTSSGTGDLEAEAADLVELGLSEAVRKRSGELHSLLLLLVDVECERGGKNPAKPAMEDPGGGLNIAVIAAMGSTKGLL